jgi:hypothetical protein
MPVVQKKKGKKRKLRNSMSVVSIDGNVVSKIVETKFSNTSKRLYTVTNWYLSLRCKLGLMHLNQLM